MNYNPADIMIVATAAMAVISIIYIIQLVFHIRKIKSHGR